MKSFGIIDGVQRLGTSTLSNKTEDRISLESAGVEMVVQLRRKKRQPKLSLWLTLTC